MDASTRAQRITRANMSNGRIRTPIGQKALFPVAKARLGVRLLAELLSEVAWDPRLGPDRERSGVCMLDGARPNALSLTTSYRFVSRMG